MSYKLDDICRGLGATYANGWLIMVGASRTSPVPGSGMRRRHERRCTLPRFEALLGDNTPSPALRGLRMITKALVSTMVLLELFARGRRKQGWLPPPSMCESRSNRLGTLCMGALGGLYRPTPRGTMVIWPGARPGCQCFWSPPSPLAAGAHRLVWYGADRLLPPLAGLVGGSSL